MRAMFKVTFRRPGDTITFGTETVIAANIRQAIEITEREVRDTWKDEDVFASDVELLGIETVGGK